MDKLLILLILLAGCAPKMSDEEKMRKLDEQYDSLKQRNESK